MIYNIVYKPPGDFFELWAPAGKKSVSNKELEIQSFVDKPLSWYKNTRCSGAGRLLRLMQLSKKVRAEVADVFYGRATSNLQFRFTGPCGFAVLSAWMHTIGTLNVSHLRHVTVHIPHPDIHGWLGTGSHQTRRTWKWLQEVQRRRGWKFPDRWWEGKRRPNY